MEKNLGLNEYNTLRLLFNAFLVIDNKYCYRFGEQTTNRQTMYSELNILPFSKFRAFFRAPSTNIDLNLPVKDEARLSLLKQSVAVFYSAVSAASSPSCNYIRTDSKAQHFKTDKLHRRHWGSFKMFSTFFEKKPTFNMKLRSTYRKSLGLWRFTSLSSNASISLFFVCFRWK